MTTQHSPSDMTSTPRGITAPLRGRLARAATAAVVALALSGVMASLATAQQATTTGTIRGTVADSVGAALEAATVIVTNSETGVRRGTQSDAAGR